MAIEAVVYSSSSVSDSRLRVDDRINKDISREIALLGDPRLGSYSTSIHLVTNQEQARQERRHRAADLLKSWLSNPDQTDEWRYEVLERELQDAATRLRED